LRIAAVVGSPRPKGNTSFLVDRALEEASQLGAETEKIMLSRYRVSPCLGHDDCQSFQVCRQKDDASWIIDRFRTADGVILATPVYYYNVSAQMKAFIDRNYFLYTHGQGYQAKAVGLIVVGESIGNEDTLHTLRQFVDELHVEDDRVLVVSGYAGRAGDVKTKLPLVEEARKLGKRLGELLTEAD
jgi:multimeric flavodoxin WrbA